MKAKVINSKSKYYGSIVNVRKMEDTQFFANRYEMVYGKGVFFGDELDFNITTLNNPVYFDWPSFRREAAKDILCAIIGNKNTVINLPDYRLGEIEVSNAIFLADELIRQLKQE